LTVGGETAQEYRAAQVLRDPKLVPGMEAMSAEGHVDMMKGMGQDVPSEQELADLAERADAFGAVTVPPGETRDLTWAFTGEPPLLGCHIPDHYEGGMRGRVEYASWRDWQYGAPRSDGNARSAVHRMSDRP
jgi:uncharacterized cupredoxin-like copper-binding protein